MGVLVATLIALAAPAAAQESGRWSYELWREIMSPFCPGRTLSDCPSPSAESLREWILVQEAAGRDRAEVKAELLERYGDAIRAAPRPEGFGLSAYAVPVAAFLAGGILVGVFLRNQMRRGAQPASPAEPLDPELERVIDEELADGSSSSR